MSNFTGIDDEEIEQSEMKEKLDLITITEAINLDNLEDKLNLVTITGGINLDTISSNVTTNNGKVGITTQQSLDIQANNLKTGITNTQISNINTNNNKVGITTDQANSITSINTMLQKTGNDTVLKTTGTKIQFYQGDSQLFNSNEIKNLTDHVLISSGVNLNTLDSDITGIKNNSLSSTLKTAVDTNSAKVGITTTQANNITTNNAKVGISTTQANNITTNNAKVGISTTQANNITTNNAKVGITTTQANNITTNNAKVGISTTQINAINANTAKVTSNWTINGSSEIHRNSNVGIKNSDPNVDLEIGDGNANPVRIRLNGSNGVAISSEIIFTDNRPANNAEFYQGASIRFNSSNNRLEFLTDEGNDNSAEPAMFIYRASTPYIQVTHIFADDLSVQTCNLRPLSRYCYGKRVHSTTDTDSVITLTTSGVPLIYQNILSNGIVYNSSTGVWTVPTTGLYEVIATLNINCGTGAESVLSLFIKEGTTNILKARSHVSRAESNNNTAMQLNMNGIVRLESSTDYNFVCASNNTGTGTIQNDLAGNNCLIIKGAVLQNDTVVPSDWNS